MKYLVLLSLLVACASKPEQLTEKAKNLEVYVNKPANCNVVGKLTGTDDMGSKELALNKVMNQAADLGATGVHVNQEVPNGKKVTVYGTAYQCE
ncbi:MAG: hypothetical protein AB7I27_12970 [Bacteriovoracaceae bacterium]